MARDGDLSLAVLEDVEPSSGVKVGALVSIEYSTCGRSMAQYSGINVAFDHSQEDRRS